MIRTGENSGLGDIGQEDAALMGSPRSNPVLSAMPIRAISSLVRDLNLLAADGAALEAEIRAGSGYVVLPSCAEARSSRSAASRRHGR